MLRVFASLTFVLKVSRLKHLTIDIGQEVSAACGHTYLCPVPLDLWRLEYLLVLVSVHRECPEVAMVTLLTI